MPRLAGKQGAVYIGANRVADIYNITLEMELAEAGVKLEVHEVYVPGRVTSRLTGERYITDSTDTVYAGSNPLSGGSVMGQEFFYLQPHAGTTAAVAPGAGMAPLGNHFIGATVTWTFYTINTVTNQGFFVTGEGFLERVTMQNPRGAASEVWEIRNTNAAPLIRN